MKWSIRKDGSFDLIAGSARIEGCYPAIDGRAVHPLSVKTGRRGRMQTVRYTLSGAVLELRFGRAGKSLTLGCTYAGGATAPHWIQPVSHGRIPAASRFFRHGLGFSGPSGLVSTAGGPAPWCYDSYLTSAVVSPEGETIAFGALTHRRFLQKTTLHNRLVRSDFCNRRIVDDVALIDAGFSTECIALGGGRLQLPDLHFCSAAVPSEALGALAAAIARENNARTHQPPCYHYCSWYQRASYFSHGDLEGILDGLDSLKPRVPLQTIQIDDGYQRSYGDWLEPSPYWPNGLRPALEEIASRGYRPGVWVAPFMVGNRSHLFAAHPEWMLRDLDGRLIAEWQHYDGTRFNEEVYILDTSHPDAFAYLRGVFRKLRAYGTRMYKTDFMDWGLKDSLLVRRARPGRTSVEYFVDVLKMIREEIGEDSYWLACISPYAPFIGFADGMRVANDVGARWSKGGLGNMLDETVWSQYFNNVFWQNDPDVTYVRNVFTRMSDAETRSLAYWNGILGGSVNTSDDLANVPAERLALWRFLEPGPRRANARLPYWGGDRRFLVAVREYKGTRGAGLLVLNPCDERHTEYLMVSELTGARKAHVFTWGPDGSHAIGEAQQITVTLEPHESRLFYLSATGGGPPRTLTLGGAR